MNDHREQGEEPAASLQQSALSPAALRALKEAEERRLTAAAEAAASPREIGGRRGPDPVRYGDWEVKGIASDF